MLDKISKETYKKTMGYDIFLMAPIISLLNSLIDFSYGIEPKKSMFERSEFTFFGSALPYEKSISEFRRGNRSQKESITAYGFIHNLKS